MIQSQTVIQVQRIKPIPTNLIFYIYGINHVQHMQQLKSRYRSVIKITYDILTTIRNTRDSAISRIARESNLTHGEANKKIQYLLQQGIISSKFERNRYSKGNSARPVYTYTITDKGLKLYNTMETMYATLHSYGLDIQ